MNLIRFLLLGSIISTLFGEFGHYPFGVTSNSIQLTDIMVFLTVSAFLIWFSAHKQILSFKPTFKILVLFWIISLISLGASLFYFPFENVLKGSLYLIRFMGYSSLFLISMTLCQQKEWPKQLTTTIINCGVVMALMGLFQLVFYNNFEPLTVYGYDPHINRLASTLLDPNFVGAYLVIPLAFLLERIIRRRDVVFMVQFLLVAVAMVLTYSRSAYLMGAVFFIAFSFIKWKKLLLLFIPFVIIISLLVPQVNHRIMGGLTIDKSAAARFESWQNGWTLFEQHPLLGIGFNNLRTAQNQEDLFKTYSIDGGHSGAGVDSSSLLVLATTGIIGGLVYLAFWFSCLKVMFQKRSLRSAIIISLLVGLFLESQFINSLFYSALMVLYFPLLGLIYE